MDEDLNKALDFKIDKWGFETDDTPKDICCVCDKVDDLNTMEYVDPDSTYDDRLICNDCKISQK